MVSLSEILARLNKLISLISTALSILGIIEGSTNKAAQENVPFHISTEVDIIGAVVTDAGFGNAALKTLLDTLTSNQATEFADIMSAIAAIPVTGAPVTLPATFPPTWATDLGNDVWGWPVPTRGNPAFTHLANAGDAAEQRGSPQVQEITPFGDAMWTVIGDWGQEGVSDPNPNSTFTLDVTTILASDATSADWLNRVYSTMLWLPPFTNGCLGLDDVSSSNWSWVVDLPIDKWLQLKANLGLINTATVAPVWPGLAKVTLGTPVAISSGFTVTGPMHGVLVDITSLAANKPFFDFDGSLSYRNIGALAFQEDNGQEEFPQNLGFTSAVYCPKTMALAAACVVRADTSMTGTVTPWTITG